MSNCQTPNPDTREHAHGVHKRAHISRSQKRKLRRQRQAAAGRAAATPPPAPTVDESDSKPPLEWSFKPSGLENTRRFIRKLRQTPIVAPFTIAELKEQLTSDGASRYASRIPTESVEITTACVVVDGDNEPLAYFLPEGLTQIYGPDHNVAAMTHDALKQLEAKYPPRWEKPEDHRNYGPIEEGNAPYHFTFWQACGQERTDRALSSPRRGAVPSKHIMGHHSANNFMYVVAFMSAVVPMIQAVAALFSCAQPSDYAEYRKLYKDLDARYSVSNFLGKTKWACFMGFAILAGLWCGPHRDVRDKLDGWVGDTAVGDWKEGGNLNIPQLGINFKLRPGGVVYMRSALLIHEVFKFSGGRRWGMVHFTHENMFDRDTIEDRLGM